MPSCRVPQFNRNEIEIQPGFQLSPVQVGNLLSPNTSFADSFFCYINQPFLPQTANVGELDHVIERAVALATHGVISLDDLPSDIQSGGRTPL